MAKIFKQLKNVLFQKDSKISAEAEIASTNKIKSDCWQCLEAIVYLATDCNSENDKFISFEQLCGSLFYADMRYREKYGKSITGETYIVSPGVILPCIVCDILIENPKTLSSDLIQKIRKSIVMHKNENGFEIEGLRKANIKELDEEKRDMLASAFHFCTAFPKEKLIEYLVKYAEENYHGEQKQSKI